MKNINPDHETLYKRAFEFYAKAPANWQFADEATKLKYTRISVIMYRCKTTDRLTYKQKQKKQEQEKRINKKLSKRTSIAMIAIKFKERIKRELKVNTIRKRQIVTVNNTLISQYKRDMPLYEEMYFWKHMRKHGIERVLTSGAGYTQIRLK